jgi:transcriptional regulator with XRE-family HTH domain
MEAEDLKSGSPAQPGAPSRRGRDEQWQEGRAKRAAEFGVFLRARRQALSPDDLGLPVGRRRVSCLRREEVANLAGVSHAWYTRLEQGAEVRPTAEVVDAIARALRLDGPARVYLRRLAGLSGDVQPGVLGSDAEDGADLQELVDQFLPNPAIILNNLFDYLAWNDTYVSLFGIDPAKLEPSNRNLLWVAFVQPSLAEDAVYRERLIASFRWHSAARVGEPEFALLIDELSAVSDPFHKLWIRGLVGDPSRRCAFDHPRGGTINMKATWLAMEHASAVLEVKRPLTTDDELRLAAAL